MDFIPDKQTYCISDNQVIILLFLRENLQSHFTIVQDLCEKQHNRVLKYTVLIESIFIRVVLI